MLRERTRPTWLHLILLFTTPRMAALWRRLALGLVVGLLCDGLTQADPPPLWRAFL
jgi:hypothetical protein